MKNPLVALGLMGILLALPFAVVAANNTASAAPSPVGGPSGAMPLDTGTLNGPCKAEIDQANKICSPDTISTPACQAAIAAGIQCANTNNLIPSKQPTPTDPCDAIRQQSIETCKGTDDQSLAACHAIIAQVSACQRPPCVSEIRMAERECAGPQGQTAQCPTAQAAAQTCMQNNPRQ